MVPSLFTAGLLFGAFVADKLGPMWWRLYWIVVALMLIRAAAVLWRRLQLFRMATGVIVGAGSAAAFGLLGGSEREISALIGGNWIWFAIPFAATLLLFVWEGRQSPEALRLLRSYSRAARMRDGFTLRHIPDLSARRDG